MAQRVLERMDAMISETDDDERPVAYDKVAGVVVTGNEDGAHHVISEVAGALVDIGFTIHAQAWTYWNRGPGPGPSYSETDEGHDWSARTARTMALNLVTGEWSFVGEVPPVAAQLVTASTTGFAAGFSSHVAQVAFNTGGALPFEQQDEGGHAH